MPKKPHVRLYRPEPFSKVVPLADINRMKSMLHSAPTKEHLVLFVLSHSFGFRWTIPTIKQMIVWLGGQATRAGVSHIVRRLEGRGLVINRAGQGQPADYKTVDGLYSN